MQNQHHQPTATTPEQPPSSAVAQRRRRDSSTRADTQTGKEGRWCSITSPSAPCLLVSSRRKRRSQLPVGRLNIPGPSSRRPSPRARPPRARHSTDGQSPFTPRATPAPMPGSVALVRDHHVVARTRSPPLASLGLTAITISRRKCRPRYTRPFRPSHEYGGASREQAQLHTTTVPHRPTIVVVRTSILMTIAVSRSGPLVRP